MGLDVGDRRIGMAISDPGGRLAFPAGFIQRVRGEQDVERILRNVQDRGAEALVVGLPLSMDGSMGPQAKKVAGFVRALRRNSALPVETVDERLTTFEAERAMREAGRKPSRYKGEADAVAAAVILQSYLDRSGGEV